MRKEEGLLTLYSAHELPIFGTFQDSRVILNAEKENESILGIDYWQFTIFKKYSEMFPS